MNRQREANRVEKENWKVMLGESEIAIIRKLREAADSVEDGRMVLRSHRKNWIGNRTSSEAVVTENTALIAGTDDFEVCLRWID